MISDLLYRLRALLFRPAVEAEMNAELQFHLDQAAARYEQAGLSPEEAARRARQDLGGTEQAREACRDVRGTRWLEETIYDLRYVIRTLRKSPLFAAVAVVSLALGIGANAAIFSVINALLLKPLPVRNPENLVSLGQDAQDDSATYALWREVRAHQDIFTGMFAEGGAGDFDLAAGGEKDPAGAQFVSGEYFHALGVSAFLGRTITEDDDRRGAAPVAVLSYAFWQRRYGSDPHIVGQTIRLNHRPFQIVGVIAPGFFGLYVGEMFEVAVPVACEPLFHPDNPYMDAPHYWWLTMYGRLKPGLDLQVASARLNAVAGPIFHELFPDDKRKPPYLVLKRAGRGLSDLRSRYSAALALLMAMVGLVLLMACANLANLLLARANARSREVAVRMALGAGRQRLIRQFLTESLLLSSIGAGLGLLIAQWSSHLMVGWISSWRERVFLSLSPDFRMIAFTAALTILTGLVFGIVPALRVTRVAAPAALKQGGHGLTGSRQQLGLSRALVSVQIAISLVLIIGAGLFVRSFRSLLTLDPGFSRDHVLLISADFTPARLEGKRLASVSEQLLERLRTLPGVQSGALSAVTPIGGMAYRWDIEIAPPDGPHRKDHSFINLVSPGYFRTMGTPQLTGRDFTAHDNAGAPPVAICNQSAVARFFPGSNLAVQIYSNPPGGKRKLMAAQIVGVVKDTKYLNLRERERPIIYLPIAQNPAVYGFDIYELRYAGPLADLIARVKQNVRTINPQISLDFRLFSTQIEESLLQDRLVARLASAFGFLALLLASLGLYGVVAYAVTRRRNEIGIRMALGSTRRAVVWLMFREIASLFAVGVPLGLAIVQLCSPWVRSLLYGLPPTDPLTLTCACLVLLGTGAAAAYFPARRAALIEPLSALREE